MSAPVIGVPVSGGPGTATIPAESASADDWSRYKPLTPHVPRPWCSVKDALSHGEECTYGAIFTNGRPHGALGARAVVAGVRQISKWSGISPSNTHLILRTLVEKKVIERHPSPKHNDGKLYIALPVTEIMRRWRAAGLTHVLKRSHGVQLVTGGPITGDPVSETRPATEPPLQTEPSAGAGDIRNKEGVLVASIPSPLIRDAIINGFGMIDNDAVSRLIQKCRQRAPDATDEEIAELAARQCKRIMRSRKVKDRVPALIRQLPRYFKGKSFADYRRKRAEENETSQLWSFIDEPVKPAG